MSSAGDAARAEFHAATPHATGSGECGLPRFELDWRGLGSPGSYSFGAFRPTLPPRHACSHVSTRLANPWTRQASKRRWANRIAKRSDHTHWFGALAWAAWRRPSRRSAKALETSRNACA